MCERLAEVGDALGRHAMAFDAGVLSGEQAGVVVAEAAAIEAMAATLNGLAAALAAEGEGWKAAGERSAAHHPARTTGSWLGRAQESLDTARRLARLPALGAAARAGAVSAQAAAVADAASVDPSAEARLLALARRRSLGGLREECARTNAAARPDAEARRRPIHAGRFLRAHADAEGGWNLRMRDNPEVGALIRPPSSLSVTGSSRRPTSKGARRARGPTRPTPWPSWPAPRVPAAASGERRAASGERRGGAARAKTIVRIDLDALLRGRVRAGEVCEIAGFGPVAVSAVRELLDTADPFLAAVVTKGVAVVGVPTWGGGPTPTSEAPSSGSIRPVRPRAARRPRGWRMTMASTGPPAA